MKKLVFTLLLAATIPWSAMAQQRAPRYEGSRHSVARIDQSNAPARTSRNTSTLYQRGIKTPSQPVDVSAISHSRTATPPARVLGDGTTLYGAIIYADSWQNTGAQYGLYSFKAAENPDVKIQREFGGGYLANGGGCYANGKYYYNSYVYTEEMGYTFSTFITLDVATGESTKVTQSFIQGTFDQTQITHDLTYDFTTGTIYAISYIKETVDEEGLIERFSPAISTMDSYTGMVSPIAKTPGFIAIAANNAGELYGITKGSNSALYRINKKSGECTEIGRTGLNPEYVQSATFDPVTDKLYWAETELTGTSGLYEVNVHTGKAELICRFPDNQEFTGIYIPAPVVADKAPAAVTELGAAFDGASLSGKLNFTAPTLANDGSELSGELMATLTIDGGESTVLDAVPGKKMQYDVTMTEGVHSFSVSMSNSAGDGPRTGYSWHVGIDGPAAVGDLTLKGNASDQPVISWMAPTTGRNGGYIDPAKLTYTVTRQPEGVKVAQGIRTTTFTDRESFKAANIYYTVTPYCDGREGIESSTATGLFGSGAELPVTYNFDTQEQFDLCTVVDANNDYEAQYHWGGWVYTPTFTYTRDENPSVAYLYSPENAADDWVFMPPFLAEQGKLYRVTFKLWTRGNKEELTVTSGQSTNPKNQTVIMAKNTYNSKEVQTLTTEFRGTSTGNNYIGFHCTSAKKMYYLFIDDVTIDEVPETSAPAAVSDLTVTADPNGALKATLSFRAPSTTAGGAALTSLSRIDVFRGNDNTAIHAFDPPAPGASLNWTDTEASQGINTYRVVAVNASGAGEKALASAYVGYDIPTAVTGLTLTEENGHPVLRWNAPTKGQNNGFLNPDELVYRIIRSDNTLMSANCKGTEFIDNSLDGSKHQYFIYYQVEPVSKAGIGDYALSDHIIYGDPYAGEFFESFDDAALSSDPWTMFRIKGKNQLWTIMSQGQTPACYDADRSGGMAVFQSTMGFMNDECRLVSPKLKVSDMQVPTFSFAFYHCPDIDTASGGDRYTDRLVPEVALPDGTYVALDEPLYVDEPKYDEGWYLYVYDLSEYKKYDWVQLSFHGYAGYANDVYVDYISLENNSEYDLMAYSFTGPSAVKPGRSAKFRLAVLNQGMKAAENYTVRLMRDGMEYKSITADKTLASGKTATYEFTVPVTIEDEGKTYSFYAEIDFADDKVTSNNVSAAIDLRVLSPDVPEVRNLTGKASGDNAVSLAWGDADALHVTDSFEDYAPFSIEDIGDYTMVDGDGLPVYTFQDIDFPNSGAPAAFMTFDPYQLHIAQILGEWAPHSGSRVLIASAPHDGAGKAAQADDWLISPQVHPGTELRFWTKTANYEWGLEKFEVMYSSTDRSTSSFKSLTGKLDAPADWTEMIYTLPADARYFAIHYVTDDGFIFYVDDLKYSAVCALEGESLKGFRVYRDGRAIADMAATDRAYDDTGVAAGDHTYGVSALFGERESQAVNVTVKVGGSGIDSVGGSAPRIRGLQGAIAIDGAEGMEVSVVNAAGVTVAHGDDADSYRFAVPAGVYVVRYCGGVRKVMVK